MIDKIKVNGTVHDIKDTSVPDVVRDITAEDIDKWNTPEETMDLSGYATEEFVTESIKALTGEAELQDGDNHFNKDTVRVGYEIHSINGIIAEQGSVVSDYIPVTNGKTVYINNLPSYTSDDGTAKRIAMFDKDLGFIGLIEPNIAREVTQYSAVINNSEAAYIAFCPYQRITNNTLLETLDYSQVMVTFNGYQDYKEYHEPTSSLLGKVEKTTKDKQLLIFGDSITETGTMNEDGSGYTEATRVNWPTFAQDMLDTTKFKNYAKSGASYRDVEATTGRQWLSNQITLAMSDTTNDAADIIVLSLGTNDGAVTDTDGAYDDAMAVETLEALDRTKLHQAIRYAMWTIRTKYPDAKCFVATPIQRASREQPESLRNAIIKMANRYNFIVIDAEYQSGIIRENEVLNGEGKYLYDGLHPNEAGAKKMAELYSSVIINSFAFEDN